MKRTLVATLTVVLLFASAVAWAQARPVMELCGSPSAEESTALASLKKWLARIDVKLISMPDCAPAGGTYLGRFGASAGAVVFTVTSPDGAQAERRIPWLDSGAATLAHLAEAGRLSEFSVILEGLITELGLDVHRETEASASVPASEGSADTTATASPSRAPKRAAPRPAASRPMAPPSMTPAGIGPAGGAASLDGSKAAPAPLPTPVEREQTHVASRFELNWSLDLSGGLRWRAPGVWTQEFCAGVNLATVRLRFGYALPTRWSIEGRPVSLGAMSAMLGWEPTLWTRGPWKVPATVAVAIERLAIQRLDLAGAVEHAFADVGLRTGLGIYLALGGGPIFLGLRVEGAWVPTRRLVQVPDGPTVELNAYSAGATALVGWDG